MSVIPQYAHDRIAVCESCEHLFRATYTCGICWCFMRVKTLLPHVACPDGRWGKVENHPEA